MYQLTVTYNNLSNFSLIYLMNKGVFVNVLNLCTCIIKVNPIC